MIEKKLKIDLKGKYKPFPRFYQASGYANADYTYTEPVKRMYDYESSYNGHITYMRLHNIMTLHGKGDWYRFHMGCDYGNPKPNNVATEGVDKVVSLNAKGEPVYDWKYVDKVYDIIVSHEMKPIVEMVYIPSAIHDKKNPCLPSSYAVWGKVVHDFVAHWTRRYGKEEVATWYFEVVNEPENYQIMRERPETFFALYDYFEKAVHSVDSSYRAGGPATKQWEEGKKLFDQFLEHCDSGVNFADGTYGTRIDFISVHCKGGRPGISVSPDTNYMFGTLREYADILSKYPRFKKTPFFNDESDISWEGNLGISHASWLNFRNTEYAPGFVCKMVNTYCDVIEDELGLNLAVVDSDNSHLPWETSLFSGNRSQLTPLAAAPTSDVIRKAFFNAYVLLSRLGQERLPLKSSDEEFGKKYGCLATRLSRRRGYALMLWNFEDGLDRDVNERRISLNLAGLGKNGSYKAVVYRIDRDHGNAYGAWTKMGRPYPLAKEQIRTLRENDFLAPEPLVQEVKGDAFSASYDMPMHSVLLLLLVKAGEKEALKMGKATVEKSVLGEPQVFLRWTYSKRDDLVGYAVYRDGKMITAKLRPDAVFVDSDVEKGKTYTYQVKATYAYGSTSTDKITVAVS